MQKIAILISDITQSAGTERAVTNLCNSLAEINNDQVYIISVYSKPGDTPFYNINSKVKVLHLNHSYGENRFKRLMVYLKLRSQIKKIINEENIEVILGTIHAYNILLSTLKRVIRIGCEHLNYNSCPSVIRPIRKKAYKKLDYVVLLTKQDAEHYKFLDANKVRVIPNITSFERDKQAELTYHRIIMVGRLAPQKGYDILVDIISNIKNKMNDWIIDIYGKGEDKELIVKQIEERGLQNIIKVHSPVSNVRDKMMESSIYLMTSRNEGLPMVLIEAQSCGLPIVAFDCPEGPREIVTDNEDGFLIKNFDKDLLGDRLVELIVNIDKRKEFGNKAFDSSKRFSPDEIVAKWSDLFIEPRGMNNA